VSKEAEFLSATECRRQPIRGAARYQGRGATCQAALAIATTAREPKKFNLLDRNLAVVEQAIA